MSLLHLFPCAKKLSKGRVFYSDLPCEGKLHKLTERLWYRVGSAFNRVVAPCLWHLGSHVIIVSVPGIITWMHLMDVTSPICYTTAFPIPLYVTCILLIIIIQQ